MDASVVFLMVFLWKVTMSSPSTEMSTDLLETTTQLPFHIVAMGKGLEEIPRGAEHVKSINYGYNHITDLPAFIFFLNNYRTIHKIELSQNQISHVSQKAFKELKQLKTLDLSGNNLSTLEPGTFKSNLRLQKLDLSNNKINFVPAKPFLNSASLEILILSDNRIEQIFEATFSKLPRLRMLMMDNNILFSIEQSSLAPMQHLNYFSLAYTGVYRLGEDMFINDFYPRVIDLTGTPLANKFEPPLKKVKDEDLHIEDLHCITPDKSDSIVTD